MRPPGSPGRAPLDGIDCITASGGPRTISPRSGSRRRPAGALHASSVCACGHLIPHAQRGALLRTCMRLGRSGWLPTTSGLPRHCSCPSAGGRLGPQAAGGRLGAAETVAARERARTAPMPSPFTDGCASVEAEATAPLDLGCHCRTPRERCRRECRGHAGQGRLVRAAGDRGGFCTRAATLRSAQGGSRRPERC